MSRRRPRTRLLNDRAREWLEIAAVIAVSVVAATLTNLPN